jgi:hypothetical protein
MASTAQLHRTYIERDIKHNPGYQAYQVLHVAFTAAPVIAGADKFTQLLASWDQYLAPQLANALGDYARTFMEAVGAVEILAGLLVALRPKIGGYVVAAWLACIIANLLLGMHYYDVALRDLGLCLAAMALGRLGALYDHPSRRYKPFVEEVRDPLKSAR